MLGIVHAEKTVLVNACRDALIQYCKSVSDPVKVIFSAIKYITF